MNLNYCLRSAILFGETRHAQLVMQSLGISYDEAFPQSIADAWWFFGCKDIPDPLPEYLSELKAEHPSTFYQKSMDRVKNTPEPKKQKFPRGSRVMIAKNLGPSMSHFPSGIEATVNHTYAHAYGGEDVKSYCLNVDGVGSVSWYDEDQLAAIE